MGLYPSFRGSFKNLRRCLICSFNLSLLLQSFYSLLCFPVTSLLFTTWGLLALQFKLQLFCKGGRGWFCFGFFFSWNTKYFEKWIMSKKFLVCLMQLCLYIGQKSLQSLLYQLLLPTVSALKSLLLPVKILSCCIRRLCPLYVSSNNWLGRYILGNGWLCNVTCFGAREIIYKAQWINWAVTMAGRYHF